MKERTTGGDRLLSKLRRPLEVAAIGGLSVGCLVSCEHPGGTQASPAAQHRALPVASTSAPAGRTTSTEIAPTTSVVTIPRPQKTVERTSAPAPAASPSATESAAPSPSASDSRPSLPLLPPKSTKERAAAHGVAAIADSVAKQLNGLVTSHAVDVQTRYSIEGGAESGTKTVFLMSRRKQNALPAATAQLSYERGKLSEISLQTGAGVEGPGMSPTDVATLPTAADRSVTFNLTTDGWTAQAHVAGTEYLLKPNDFNTGLQKIVQPSFMQKTADRIIPELR